MEALIPLIIVAAGILVSAFKGNKEKKNAGPRNIDKDKLNNPNRPKTTSSRSTTQRSSNRESEPGRGIFGDLVGELEKGFKEFQDEMNQNSDENSNKGLFERRRAQLDDAKQSSRRIAQDTYQRSRKRVEDEVSTYQDMIDSRGNTISDEIDVGDVSTGRPERQRSERSSVDRSSRNEKVAQRAAEGRERNRVDSDFVRTGEIGSYEFRVDRKTVLDGIIFSEILNKPKSRQ